MGRDGPEMVTASEIASFVYCPEAWRLEHGLGLEPANRAALDAGHAASRTEGGGGAGRGRLDHAGAGSGRPGGRGAAPAALVVVMSLPAGWIAVAAVLALLLGLWLVLAGRGMRRRRGLGGGKTVSLDRVTLTSRRLGLTGRPDRLIKTDGTIIVEEWKSARPAPAVAPGPDGRLFPADRGRAADSAVAWLHRLRRRHAAPDREYRRAAGLGARAGRADPGGEGGGRRGRSRSIRSRASAGRAGCGAIAGRRWYKVIQKVIHALSAAISTVVDSAKVFKWSTSSTPLTSLRR